VTSLAATCDFEQLGDLCYDPGHNRMVDLISIMASVRQMGVAMSTIALALCGRAAAPVNMVLFPLLDINLAKSMHNLVNAVLYTVLQLPSVTAQRCKNHGPFSSSLPQQKPGSQANATLSSSAAPKNNNPQALVMCLPDFNPPINMLVTGLRNLGFLIDNWVDVSSIIAQRSLGLLKEGEAECRTQALSLTPAFYSRQLFDSEPSNRPKIVVGLTPGLYAITDGKHAQYFNHYDSVETIASPNVWPIEFDTRFGVAAVTYMAGLGSEERDSMGEASTTMLGC
jgi:hypothetical protein